MKILFVCEYFHPFAHGGSERSIYYLAQGLINNGNQVSVCTYNFGTAAYEIWNKIQIFRIPSFVKIKKENPRAVGPFTFSNPFSAFYTFLYLLIWCIKHKPNIIHVQSSYTIIPAIAVSKFLNIPAVITLRDYQPLCPLGYCIRKENNFQKCNLIDFLTSDIIKHMNLYLDKSKLWSKVYFITGSVYGWVYSIFIRITVSQATKVVCISSKEKSIYEKNNIKVNSVIYNSMQYKNVKKNRKNQIIFVGRLTYGKGAHLILVSFIPLLKLYPKLKLLIIGQGPLFRKITNKVKELKLSRNILVKGGIGYKDTLNNISQSKLAIVPSVWEEPFGRVALESIMLGTPVIASNKGGLREIVEDDKYGYITDLDPNSIYKAIKKALVNNEKLIKIINDSKDKLVKKFTNDPVNKYLSLYKSI